MEAETSPRDVTDTPQPAEVVEDPIIQNASDAPQQPEPKRRGGRVNLNRGDLKEKEACTDCGKLLSKHALIYNTHKCPAKNKKQIIIENIEPPPVINKPVQPPKKQQTQLTHPDPQPQLLQLPRNYIDLDGDIDYSHLNVNNFLNKYVQNLRENDKRQKQNKYKSMLSGRV